MTPKIAFAPLFISWLGFGLLPKVIIVFLVCFFPIVLNAILAFGSLSEELTRFCRATGADALGQVVRFEPRRHARVVGRDQAAPARTRPARTDLSRRAPITGGWVMLRPGYLANLERGHRVQIREQTR